MPEHVAREMELAATALLRLTRQPTGEAPWRDFYATFCERYGTGTLVPVTDVVNTGAGIGFPAGYPGSVLPARSSGPSERDERLLALAWNALADGSREIVLDDAGIRALTVGDASAELRVPPHVELAARIRASSLEALERGDYLLTVAPGRSAGTFTSRFATLVAGAAEDVFVADSRSVAAQLRHPPGTVPRNALVAVNLIATVSGFLGGIDRAMCWLTSRTPVTAVHGTDRPALAQVVALTGDLGADGPAGSKGTVVEAWQARSHALAAYQARLPTDADTDAVLESLLHMHAIRAIGVDRDREATCRQLARRAALTWTAQHTGNR